MTRSAPGLPAAAVEPHAGEVDGGHLPAAPGQPQRVPALARGQVDGVARREVRQQLRDQRVRLRRPLLPLAYRSSQSSARMRLESVVPACHGDPVTTQQDLALLRLVAQRLAGPRPATAADAVRRLTAAQAQDLPGALLSVALRTTAGTRGEVESALDAGDVVRSWPMRGTLHLVAAEDLPWMLGLLGPRVLAGAPARRTQLGITDADIEQARGLAVQALGGGRQLRRAEILAALADGGVDITGQRGYHLLWYLSQTCTLCLGPIDDGEQLFVLHGRVDPRAPAPGRRGGARRAGRGGSSAGTGRRRSRTSPAGPASGSRESRAALAAARDGLARLEVDGVEYFLDPETPDLLAAHRDEAVAVRLLPGFDEFVLGYADRTCAVPPEFADRIVPGGNGMFRPTVVSGGRVVGTWGWSGRGAKRTVTATPFTVFADDVTLGRPRAGRRAALTGSGGALDQEDGDLPVGLLLVLGVRREGGHGPLPPLGLLLAGDLAGHAVPGLRAVLDGHLVRVRAQVGHPRRVRRGAALRADHHVRAVVLDPHQAPACAPCRSSRPGW